jgi:hypothetical protein
MFSAVHSCHEKDAWMLAPQVFLRRGNHFSREEVGADRKCSHTHLSHLSLFSLIALVYSGWKNIFF